MIDRVLDRKPSPPDERDYKLANYLKPVTLPVSTFWDRGHAVLDQKDTGHCVGFGWAQWGNTLPVNDNFLAIDAHNIYYEAKAIEGDPKGEDGAYGRDGAKAMKARGRLNAYAFGDINDARQFLLTQGPVCFGLDWYEGMFTPDAQGVIRPTGKVKGGHWIVAYGCDANYVYFENSWGSDWGIDGTCKMEWRDVAYLMSQQGEACAAVELPLPVVPPEPDTKSCLTSIFALLDGFRGKSNKIKQAKQMLKDLLARI